MKRRDEDNLVAVLELVVELTFKFPVGVIDEHEDPWAPVHQLCNIHQAQTYTPSPSTNMSSRSETRFFFIHWMRKRISAGLPEPGMVRGMWIVCLGCAEKIRCRPPLLSAHPKPSVVKLDVPELEAELDVVVPPRRGLGRRASGRGRGR